LSDLYGRNNEIKGKRRRRKKRRKAKVKIGKERIEKEEKM
jgi:hypothetical protein